MKATSKPLPFMSSSQKIDQNRIVTSYDLDENAVTKMFLPFAGAVVFISLQVSQFLCCPAVVDEMKALTTSFRNLETAEMFID